MADEPVLSTDLATGDNALSPSAPGDRAPSPGADHGEPRESLHDAIERAVPELRRGRDVDDDGDGASPAQVARRAAADDDPELPEEVTAEELARLSQSAKRRINKLSKQRQKLAGEVQRLKMLEPSAQAAEQVTRYLQANDISRDDFLMSLELASAMRRGDFKTFYEGVRPYMKLAEEYLGLSLPPDLQQQVQQGHMTTQAAAMYSKERMDRAMAQTNAARLQQTSANQQQQHQRQTLADQVTHTVNAWEQRVMQSDPDYAAKKNAVQNTMWAVVREQGVPQSPDHAVKIAEEAYRRVNADFRAWAPQRRPTSRIPSSTGRTAGVTSEPKSLLDAVRQARETARL